MHKDTFFAQLAERAMAVTFDDVRLESDHSEVLPHQVVLTSHFTRNIPLNIPIVSAAMDTVTEAPMAIALAIAGGIGVIHRNLSPEEQARHVAKVKYFMNGRIEKPIFVRSTDTIAQILKMRDEKGFSFHTFPVLDATGRVKGLLTRHDFEYCQDNSRSAEQIMTLNVVTSEQDTNVDQAFGIMSKHKCKALPIVDNDLQLLGLYIYSDVNRIRSGASSRNNVDERGQLRVAAAVGTGDDAYERAALLAAKNVDVIVMDTAHGDTGEGIATVRELKRLYKFDVMAGNVSRGESARRLAGAGADGVRSGQGPGSICTTTPVSGIGKPQLSSTHQCVKALEGTGVPICSDGGFRFSGDITKALAAGATSITLGKMLAGTDEAPGDITMRDGVRYKCYRGMGSLAALKENRGSRGRYRQQDVPDYQLVPEGVEAEVPYQGPVAHVIHQYLGGLRSGMGYIGARTIQELQERAEFFQVTPAGRIEGNPHDVAITREAPNYRGGDR